MSSNSSSKDDDSVCMEKMEHAAVPKTKARDGWQGRMDFILTCIGYAVGLGNIWRFPYLCYKSGGGAFFIPYIIFLLLCGFPLFFMEVAFGQFSSLSPVTIWRICPLFKGVGMGMVIVSAIVCIYYNVIVAWTIYYLFMSFRSVLPWSHCHNSWNDDRCVDGLEGTLNKTMLNITSVNLTKVTASEQFWENHVLDITDGIEDSGSLRWQLFICLSLAWLCVFLCLFKGVKVLGKVMHFAAPFPYLVLLVLLIRGLTLPGAVEGIKFYIIPRWEKLADFQVWGDAALQIFYSVGMAWGGIITMASYNNFHNNAYRDAMLVPIINCGTSIFAGFVIFSVLGFMAHTAGTTVDEVVKQGPGLTFVAYPEAVAKLPISPLWAVLFFLMLYTIGLDSQTGEAESSMFGMFETCISSFIDEYPRLLRSKRVLLAAVGCFVEFLLGLPCITQGGIYVLQIMDWYCASFSLMMISLIECLVIAWIYGTERFYKDIELMIGYKPHAIWHYMWRFVTPTVIFGIWLFSIITLGPVTYDGKSYPTWAIVFGWILGIVSLVPIPLMMIIQIINTDGDTIIERVKKLTVPAKTWGPSMEDDREIYIQSLSHNTYTLSNMDGSPVDCEEALLQHKQKIDMNNS
ncbi:Sodium- and chloride-dependent neutral and basic amino acid transporter B(0+),Sodium- and chloride-dependent taurine transporter,Sodium-dependent noradrenaline transporter,Sodium-dependent proline transporter,Sodium-and chloride-dependent glycine transporter 1,Sodium-dependent neutral amino acid transporter SLC6A17,Sodium- and chloride-dependent GABA transporter ine,Sodium- and chloride-dependent GABA transporter 3,Sodium- and chloride-dependent betaine transporter,Sodium- and chloride-dependent GABA trans|uniref:Transporter n=1 Tax=Mytilus coruscus TaxID=42192 RepID=A0A6J8AW39_MYTCO|nr:Sodium- and chloride-dependent neutral and basic amino acid transporter B(0+),Sodium- and chloride-dependent taurine transporter,Sodium-dependent noradrenaline transporter,Sodium-dependent proline transporter,Sodium-and chloride-dependent glycine transporter 1,Sodium-dependent neutral amino acid transporter SLC6A17,Sodium- and chloride-dependent GABA transporter ine,Sodium- and chloride-dependent GABA transporter 3,Sodium- and chloride-dependent betaine transporter,Sodium- and chloride-dependent